MHLAQAVTLRSHSGGGTKLNRILTDFDEITKMIEKLNRLLKSSIMNENTGSDRLYL